MAEGGDPGAVAPPTIAATATSGASIPAATTSTGPLAFDDVYRIEVAPMLRLATLLTGSPSAAEDLVAESFAKLLVKWQSVDQPGAYVRRCVGNAGSGRRRRSWREAPTPISTDAIELDDDLSRVDMASALAEALATLPARQRAAIVLRFYSGLSELEAAEALGCRPGTVGSLVHRGLAGLRIELEEDRS